MPFPRRIRPPTRPLRPPLSKCYSATKPRSFTYHAQLLLISPGILRPQLAFLTHAPNNTTHASPQSLPPSRFLSTSTRQFWKETARDSVKVTVLVGIVIAGGVSWAWMLTQELVDREFPAPKEWSFLSKVAYHAGKGLEVPAANEEGEVDWVFCGWAWLDLLKRLEDPNVDGVGLVVLDGEGGFDVEGKSYEWRRGYYEALMGCGKAAVELENVVKDTSRGSFGGVYFNKEYMIGPSNPKPKKQPPWMRAAPLEENCVPAHPPPETFYLKVLTTKGFSSKEKMDAALAYGTWLDHKGLHDTGEEIFQWALDLATADLDSPSSMLEPRTGIIKPDTEVTDNVLDAATALGVHRAQVGDTNSALPIFLSVLRARRAAPIAEQTYINPTSKPRMKANDSKTDIDVLGSYFAGFWSLLQASKFPPPPPSGKEAFVRTPNTSCDEASAMLYIGETLFATSPSEREAGLSWTRNALNLAVEGYMDPRISKEAKKKCVQCLRVGTANRRKMVTVGLTAVEEKESESASWMAWGRSEKRIREEKEKWERERMEMADFSAMVTRGRMLEVRDEVPPLWGSYLLKEWILPRLRR